MQESCQSMLGRGTRLVCQTTPLKTGRASAAAYRPQASAFLPKFAHGQPMVAPSCAIEK